MPERRMFSKTVIDSDNFLEMPQSSQLLYFHIAMRADDEGFVNNAKRIGQLIGATDKDLNELVSKNFVISFDNGVYAVTHWKVHNAIRGDRFKQTVFITEKEQLTLLENGVYVPNKKKQNFSDNQPTTNCPQTDNQPTTNCPHIDNQPTTNCPQTDNQPTTNCPQTDNQPTTNCPHIDNQVTTINEFVGAQDRLGKDRLSKDRLSKDKSGKDKSGKDSTGKVYGIEQQSSSTDTCARDPTPVEENMSKSEQIRKLSEEFGQILPKLLASLREDGKGILEESYEELRRRCKRLTAQ